MDKKNLVVWSVKMTDSDRDWITGIIADWKHDTTESNVTTLKRLLEAAITVGPETPSETLKAFGDAKETLLVLMQKLNAVADANTLTIKELNSKLVKASASNDELRHELQEQGAKMEEQHQKVIDQLRSELKKIRTENEELKKQLDQQNQINELKKKLDALQKGE